MEQVKIGMAQAAVRDDERERGGADEENAANRFAAEKSAQRRFCAAARALTDRRHC
ncbi:MAG TPA: hypothetical protein VES64_06655 [Allosphingosinicella sp.]|nr:hypothetical protein [Allosphingosinicella sp.]